MITWSTHIICIDNVGYKHTITMCNNSSFTTATVVRSKPVCVWCDGVWCVCVCVCLVCGVCVCVCVWCFVCVVCVCV